ncbi:hypothetical protein HJFPF1_13114 [Paramyrothecium foliicola]|nr:hypothetical protein HJFPF1_13114 [Paramyrothecium foliicola]
MYSYVKRILLYQRKNEHDSIRVICEHVPQLKEIWRHLEKQSKEYQNTVVSHMHGIFVEHLKQVRKRSDSAAKLKRVRVAKLAVTIPPNWDALLQKDYEEILVKIWCDIRHHITFVYECEAVGHWVLRLHQEKLYDMKPDKVVLADFGGHTLNTYVFDTVFRKDGKGLTFFATDDFAAKCTHGGSEFHAALVQAKLAEKIKINETNLTADQAAELVGKYMANYRQSVRGDVNDKAFFLQELSKNTVVVLSGGTFRNTYIKYRAIETIKRMKLHNLEWTDEMTDGNQRSGVVSMGAALAVANSMTVKDFLGQCFIVVDECRSDQSDEQPLEVVYCRGKSRKVDIDLGLPGRTCHKIFLCCAPLPCGSDMKTATRSETCELHLVGCASVGKWRIWLEYDKMTYDGCPDTDCLVYSQFRLDGCKEVQNAIWPVYYDPGACTLFLDTDKIPDPASSTLTFNKHINSWDLTRSKKVPRYRQDWMQNQIDAGLAWWADDLSGLGDSKSWAEDITPRPTKRRAVCPETYPNSPSSPQEDGIEANTTSISPAVVNISAADIRKSAGTTSSGIPQTATSRFNQSYKGIGSAVAHFMSTNLNKRGLITTSVSPSPLTMASSRSTPASEEHPPRRKFKPIDI